MTVNTFDKNSKSAIELMDRQKIIRPNTFFGCYELAELNEHLSYEGSSIKKWITATVVKKVFGFNLPYQNYDTVDEDIAVRMEIYKEAITNLVQPGLNHIFMHAAIAEEVDSFPIPKVQERVEGLDEIIRKADFKIWSSDEMKHFLEEQEIILINYRELQKIQELRN